MLVVHTVTAVSDKGNMAKSPPPQARCIFVLCPVFVEY